MNRKEQPEGSRRQTGRSVQEILQRQRRQNEHHLRTVPPDFTHGRVAVGEVYEVFGSRWVERAVFVVEDDGVTTVAYFDDYFLVIEQHAREPEQTAWRSPSSGRDRVVALQPGDRGDLAGEAAITLDISRERLARLERDVLGVVRDALAEGSGRARRRRRGEIDVLSLVALMCRLSQ